jgi:hypothetical protein
MDLPSFRDQIEFSDLDNFYKTRLSQDIVLWPEQAIPLLGYMCWPNDPEQRDQLMRTVRSWPEGSKQIPPRLRRIQEQWLRVADVFHSYFDLDAGNHQERRGGPSIGKAITLVDANAKSRGTAAASLWNTWAAYKDVAHLVTAATLIFADVHKRFCEEQIGQFGLPAHQFMPFPLAMMMPDLVLAIALGFERFGLSRIPRGKTESTLNPDTLWRIPPAINVTPVEPPWRKLRKQDLAVLNARRAGNRGKTKQHKTTPAFGVASCG